ncbi:copper resistance protein NlpE [Flavobacterium oreochromis]|uniref:copper resistance protein NlpE n=1 Tax=Flavobacterium oreochromis TaxID=2906078 RepID=UPI00385D9D57
MKKIAFIFLATGALFLTNCKRNETGVSTSTDTVTAETDFIGMYSGTIPCADCMGIYTHLTFKKDGKIAKSTLYLDSDETSLNEYGTWTKTNDIIEVKIANTPTEYYTVKPNNTLVMLDSNKKETTGELSKNYIFEKTAVYTTSELNGTYQTESSGKGYNQILELKADNDSIYNVKVSFTGASKGCTFEGKGQLINNQIDIELNKIEKNLKGTMTIVFKNQNKIAEISTSKFDDRLALNYFCGGGASLAGDYTKK